MVSSQQVVGLGLIGTVGYLALAGGSESSVFGGGTSFRGAPSPSESASNSTGAGGIVSSLPNVVINESSDFTSKKEANTSILDNPQVFNQAERSQLQFKQTSGGSGGLVTKKGQKVSSSFKANDPSGLYTPIENIKSGTVTPPKYNSGGSTSIGNDNKSSKVGAGGFAKIIGNILTGGLFR